MTNKKKPERKPYIIIEEKHETKLSKFDQGILKDDAKKIISILFLLVP